MPFEPATEVVITARRRRMLLAHLRDDDVEPSAELFETLLHGPPSLPLPEPITDLPRAVASALQLSPDDQRTAAEWATSLHAGATTLRRAFVVETGLTFSEWRTRLRLNRSLDLLARGLMVSSVAQRVGFTSTNGFILAFRRYLASPPVRTQYPSSAPDLGPRPARLRRQGPSAICSGSTDLLGKQPEQISGARADRAEPTQRPTRSQIRSGSIHPH